MFRCNVPDCYWADTGLKNNLFGLSLIQLVKNINLLKKQGKNSKVSKVLTFISENSFYSDFRVNIIYKKIDKNHKLYYYFKCASGVKLNELKKLLENPDKFDFKFTEDYLKKHYCLTHDKLFYRQFRIPKFLVPHGHPAYKFSRHDVGKEAFIAAKWCMEKVKEKNIYISPGEILWFEMYSLMHPYKIQPKIKQHHLYLMKNKFTKKQVLKVDPGDVFRHEIQFVPQDVVDSIRRKTERMRKLNNNNN